ncbi:MAG: response regulator, partial [Anaerolineales bacterium]
MSSIDGNELASEIKSSLKILVVDDDVLNRRLMKVLLTHAGYHVDLASNGEEAFDAIKYQQFDI